MYNSKAYIKIRILNKLAGLLGWIDRKPHHLGVLTFHNVGNDDSIHTLDRKLFTDFLYFLSDNDYRTIRACDLVASWPYMLNKERHVILTFDDGYSSHKDVVCEILSRFNMTATFFVLSSLVAKERISSVFSNCRNVFMSYLDIQQLIKAGFEIGSHTHTHPLCGLISKEEFRKEIILSKQILEEIIQCPVTSFSYPYGRKGAYSLSHCSDLNSVGYTAAFTQAGTRIKSTSNMFALPRINVDRFDTIYTFENKLLGKYEPIFRLRNWLD